LCGLWGARALARRVSADSRKRLIGQDGANDRPVATRPEFSPSSPVVAITRLNGDKNSKDRHWYIKHLLSTLQGVKTIYSLQSWQLDDPTSDGALHRFFAYLELLNIHHWRRSRGINYLALSFTIEEPFTTLICQPLECQRHVLAALRQDPRLKV
jgi:hypothetical protein